MTKRQGLLAISVNAATTILVVAGCVSQDGEGDNGTGFNYRDKFYGLSSAEVRSDRLGPVLDRDVGFRDTSTDVRAILDVDPATAVAARVHDVPGTPADDGVAWLLASPDADLTVDPWADPGLVVAIYPDR